MDFFWSRRGNHSPTSAKCFEWMTSICPFLNVFKSQPCFQSPLCSCSGRSPSGAASGQQAVSRAVVPELARRPAVPPRCSSLSIIKVGSARASGPGSFINWITCKINVHLLQRSNGLLPLAEIISVGLRMTAEGSAQWMGRFAALHTKWIVHHCLIKGLLETLVSSPPDSKP